jgi:hypothetical protein
MMVQTPGGLRSFPSLFGNRREDRGGVHSRRPPELDSKPRCEDNRLDSVMPMRRSPEVRTRGRDGPMRGEAARTFDRFGALLVS